jgi:hypothetical protein
LIYLALDINEEFSFKLHVFLLTSPYVKKS